MLCVTGADKNRYTDQTQNDRSQIDTTQKDTTQKETTQNGHVRELTYSNLERTYPRTDISQNIFIQERTYSRRDKSQNGQILEWTNLRTDNPKNDSEINFIISKFIHNKVYGLQFISWVRLVQVTLGQVRFGQGRITISLKI